MPKPKTEGELSASPIPPTRVTVVNPLSKGNLGKTTFYEYLVSALENAGIPWEGANLDSRHLAFHQRHIGKVRNFITEGLSAVDEYLPVFTAARRSAAQVYLIDQRAQADRSFVVAARHTGFLSLAKEDGVSIVPVCVALDDIDYMNNLGEAITALAEAGVSRWLVVAHPQLAPNSAFLRSPPMKRMQEANAALIEVPWVSNITFHRMSALAAQEKRSLSFREVVQHPSFNSGEGSMCRFELEDAMGRMEVQFAGVESILLPPGLRFRRADPEPSMTPPAVDGGATDSEAMSAAFLNAL